MSQKISAKAMCEYCSWSAKATGDDIVEVGTFLRRLCIEHCEAMHADADYRDRLGVPQPRKPKRSEDA